MPVAQNRTVNTRSGLPRTVDVNKPEELAHVMNRILEIMLTWNGEIGSPDERLITAREFEQ